MIFAIPNHSWLLSYWDYFFQGFATSTWPEEDGSYGSQCSWWPTFFKANLTQWPWHILCGWKSSGWESNNRFFWLCNQHSPLCNVKRVCKQRGNRFRDRFQYQTCKIQSLKPSVLGNVWSAQEGDLSNLIHPGKANQILAGRVSLKIPLIHHISSYTRYIASSDIFTSLRNKTYLQSYHWIGSRDFFRTWFWDSSTWFAGHSQMVFPNN